MPPKKKVQDILPSKRRAIREVAIDDDKTKKTQPEARQSRADRGIRVPVHLVRSLKESPAEKVPQKEPRSRTKTTRSSKKNGWLANRWAIGSLAFVCLLIIAYVSSTFLARAKVTIYPRALGVPVNGTFSATRNAGSPNLSFDTVSTTTIAHMSVPASAGVMVNTYASGMAMLINASSPNPQKILAGTRLEDARGLVYKTASTVVIPPATSKSSGTIPVKIVANTPGTAYNLQLNSLKGDLSIVAWQGTPKAKVFYGRATSDITGGSSGARMTVSGTVLSNAASSLSSNLSSSALSTIESIIPQEYILYPGATRTVFSSTTINSTGSTTADVSIGATITGIYFKKSDLENAIAKNQISQFPADNYKVSGLDSLVFSAPSGQKLSFTSPTISFSLSGNINIVGIVDAASIKKQLEGISISKSSSVFNQYNSIISSAEVSIVPFWIHTIPSSPEKISVVISTSTKTKQ